MNKIELGKNDEQNIDFALDLVKSKVLTQNDAHNALESKIGVLLGFVGVIASGALAFIVDHRHAYRIGPNTFTAGIVGIFTAMVFLVCASRTRKYLDAPKFEDFYSEEALAKKTVKVKNKVVANMIEAYKRNTRNQERKALWYDLAVAMLLISSLLVLIAITCRHYV